MSKKGKETIDIPQFLMELIVNVFLLAMVGVFPLFYLNNYINIVGAKLIFFKTASIFLIVMGMFFLVVKLLHNRGQNRKIELKEGISITTICGMVFATVVCISCILSPAGKEAFWGEQGRRLGGLVLLLCVGVYLVVSYCYQTFQGLIWIFLISNGLVWILVILQFWGVDLLHLYDNLVANQHFYFMGTMGNININSGYACVLLAIILALYFQSETKFSRRCYGGMILIGFYAAYATQSQSWVLGMGAVAFILLWVGLESREKLVKVGEIWLLFILVSIVLKIMLELAFAAGYILEKAQRLVSDKMFMILLSKEVLIIQMALWSLMFILSHRYQIKYKRMFRGILLGVCITAVLAACFAAFPLDDSFGSNRGYIWRVTLEEFWKLPVLQKLFGYGPNCFWRFMDINRAEEMRMRGTIFIDAHNEALQFLAVTGILGMLSYLGMQVSIMVRCAKVYAKNPIAFVGLIAIAAYMGQGLVNNPQIFTTPLLFLFMGIIESKLKKSE